MKTLDRTFKVSLIEAPFHKPCIMFFWNPENPRELTFVGSKLFLRLFSVIIAKTIDNIDKGLVLMQEAIDGFKTFKEIDEELTEYVSLK